MPNTLLTDAHIAYETTAVFMNNLVYVGQLNRQYSNEFAKTGAQIGNEIHIRKPMRGVVGQGRVVTPQDITETYVTLRLNYRLNIGLNYTSEDRLLSMDDFRNRYITPNVVEVANEVDRLCLRDTYYQLYNTGGTPGTTPSTSAVFLNAKARMLNEATPDDKRWISLITPNTQAGMVEGLKGLFNAQLVIGEQYKKGMMGKDALGYDWYYSQNMPTHVVGPLGGTPTVSGAGQTGSSLLTTGWPAAAAARLKQGDVFTIGSGATGMYAVNPKTRESTGELRQLVVMADFSSDASGNGAISISPPITPLHADGSKDQFQTVVASPANGATLNILGAANTSSPQNLLYHPDFASVGFADLPMPTTGKAYRIVDDELGVSMRVWESSDWLNDMHGVRIDVLFGIVVIYPEWAHRVAA